VGYYNTYLSQTAKDARATLVDVFDRIGTFFLTHRDPRRGATDPGKETVIHIMRVVPSILAIAMKEIKSGRMSE